MSKKKSVALLVALVLGFVAFWFVPGFNQEAEAGCSFFCQDCMGFLCEDLPFAKCECNAWDDRPAGGRGCIAGGGNCIPWM